MSTAAASNMTSPERPDPIEKKLDMSLDEIVQENKQQQKQQQPALSPVAKTPEGRAKSKKRAERLALSGDVDMEDDATAGRRVYVGNLSWSVKWQELKDHMRAAGEVERAVVLESNGRSKGCGIVTFATQDEAEQAIETLNDSELEGRKIFVWKDREVHVTPSPHKGTRVFVGNLSWTVKWQDLKDHMKQAGNVIHADVLFEAKGRSKGCGLVEYETSEEAQIAIKTLNDTELEGRKVFVREDREPEGGSISSIVKRASSRASTPARSVQAQSSSPPAAPTNIGSSIYVGNLPWDITWQALKDVFRQAGNVEHAEIAQFSSGRSRGFGIVRFSNPQEARQAIERFNGADMNGRAMEVRFDKGK